MTKVNNASDSIYVYDAPKMQRKIYTSIAINILRMQGKCGEPAQSKRGEIE